MAQQLSHISILIHFFLFIQGNMIGKVKGGTCQVGLGECKTDCAERCQQQYAGGQGQCDDQYHLCTCYYPCGPYPPPKLPSPKRCQTNYGTCNLKGCGDACCLSRCQTRYPPAAHVQGTCLQFVRAPLLCLCQFDC